MEHDPFSLVKTAPAPRIGLGLAALGRPAYINLGHGGDVGNHPTRDALESRAHAVLDHAWTAGVRYFDAARSYGLAEAFLGRWLDTKRIDRDDLMIGSKWGYRYTANWDRTAQVHEVKEHTRRMLDAQWPETLASLGTPPDLYQIHSATLESGVLDDQTVLDGLRDLAAGGVLIGLSTSGPHQAAAIRKALAIEREAGVLLFDAVQTTWNLLEPSAGAALADAAAAGLSVIVKEALANGRLTERDPEVAARLRDLHPGAPPDAIAIAAALQQPWSPIVLSGATTADQLDSNLAALSLTGELPDAHEELAETPRDYWAHRSELPWT